MFKRWLNKMFILWIMSVIMKIRPEITLLKDHSSLFHCPELDTVPSVSPVHCDGASVHFLDQWPKHRNELCAAWLKWGKQTAICVRQKQTPLTPLLWCKGADAVFPRGRKTVSIFRRSVTTSELYDGSLCSHCSCKKGLSHWYEIINNGNKTTFLSVSWILWQRPLK